MKKLSLTTQIGIALLLAVAAGIDRLIDMGRTVMSVTGDASCAVVMQKLLERNCECAVLGLLFLVDLWFCEGSGGTECPHVSP